MTKIKNPLIVRSRSARFIIVSKMMERDWVRYVYSTSGSNQVCINQYHYQPFYINKCNCILKIKHSQTYMSCVLYSEHVLKLLNIVLHCIFWIQPIYINQTSVHVQAIISSCCKKYISHFLVTWPTYCNRLFSVVVVRLVLSI